MPPVTHQEGSSELQPEIETGTFVSKSQHVLGAVSLVLIGVASFFFVFSYLDTAPTPSSQTAAAAERPSTFQGISLEAKSAIVIELNSGKVLFEKNADAQLPLASLTKVPLALVAAEVLDPNTIVTMPYNTALTEGGQRLLKGERWTVRDLMHFTLIASSNEGADVLATQANPLLNEIYFEATRGEETLWRMNDLAKELGLRETRFDNVSGLDIDETTPGAFGSARDMAQLFAYAATTRPDIYAGTTKEDLSLVDQSGATTVAFNTNEILSYVPALIMGKTGFTDLAGGNLAIVFDAGLSQPVVAVVLGSSRDGRFSDVQRLVDAARADISAQ